MIGIFSRKKYAGSVVKKVNFEGRNLLKNIFLIAIRISIKLVIIASNFI